MIITTSEKIAGREVVETIGLVRGSTVRAKHIGNDIMATLKNIVGGEIEEYTKLQTDAREQAIARMTKNAVEVGADAIISTRLESSMIAGGASEIVAYGTAVKLQ